MFSRGLFSLLALSAVSTASPISVVRRSWLIDPATISNDTSGAYTANFTDTTNVASDVANTTTMTCVIPASQLPTLMNSTDLSNMTSIYNCTDMTNSTALSNSTDTLDLSPSNNTPDTSGLTPPDNSTSTDTNDGSTNDPTDGSTDDSTNDTTNPPSDTPPIDSSGIFNPATGEFTANTTDPNGRRRRSLSQKWLPSPVMLLSRRSSNRRRIAHDDLPAVAQN